MRYGPTLPPHQPLQMLTWIHIYIPPMPGSFFLRTHHAHPTTLNFFLCTQCFGTLWKPWCMYNGLMTTTLRGDPMYGMTGAYACWIFSRNATWNSGWSFKEMTCSLLFYVLLKKNIYIEGVYGPCRKFPHYFRKPSICVYLSCIVLCVIGKSVSTPLTFESL
jgi:hypothetical protein